jgi:hypothetical protein
MAVLNCGTPYHVEPWYNCEHCRKQKAYGFSLKGDGWTKPEDYAPPMDELDARRNEQADRAGGNRTVETFGER